MHLIVIRHGETEMNRENRLQGSRGADPDLNRDGMRMVESLRDGLLVEPAHIYASPLKRTQTTANILNERFHVPITLVPELVERDFGSLSGKLRSEVDSKILEKDLEGIYDYHALGGESVEDVRKRVLYFLSTLPLTSDETVFIITHRGIIRLMYDLFPNDVISNEDLPASKHVFDVVRLPEV